MLVPSLRWGKATSLCRCCSLLVHSTPSISDCLLFYQQYIRFGSLQYFMDLDLHGVHVMITGGCARVFVENRATPLQCNSIDLL